ncbi:hypothetical protein HED63_26505 [Ochrobactrum cytisi]|nr:hypothetical protein [Brucella cytisi]
MHFFSDQDDANERELARTAHQKGARGLVSIVLGGDGSVCGRSGIAPTLTPWLTLFRSSVDDIGEINVISLRADSITTGPSAPAVWAELQRQSLIVARMRRRVRRYR